jgi:hypothetical protein
MVTLMKFLRKKPAKLKKRLVNSTNKFINFVKNKPSKFAVVSFSCFLVVLFAYQLVWPLFTHYSYKLNSANQLLSESSQIMAKKSATRYSKKPWYAECQCFQIVL